MEDLLDQVDFSVDFDMDTSDLDCLSDSLLDLDEDDLIKFDMLINSDEEIHELSDDDLTSTDFNIEKFLTNDENYKNFSVFNNLKSKKDNKSTNYSQSLILNSNNIPLNSIPLNSSLNSLTNSNNLSWLNSSINNSSLNSSSLNNSSFNNSNSILQNNSTKVINKKSTANQCFLKNENDFSIDSYFLNYDEDYSNTNDQSLENTSQMENNVPFFTVNYSKDNSFNNENDSSYYLINQTNHYSNKYSYSYSFKLEQTCVKKLTKSKQNSKGTSLLASKPKNLKNVKKESSRKTNSIKSKEYSNYGKFIKYFYQDHNYCSFSFRKNGLKR